MFFVFPALAFSEISEQENIALIRSFPLVFVDCIQTLDIRHTSGVVETNKVLGKFPSDTEIILYFSIWSLSNYMICKFLPDKLSIPFLMVQDFLQIDTISANNRDDDGVPTIGPEEIRVYISYTFEW